MKLMEFVINLAIGGGDKSAKEISKIQSEANAAGSSLGNLEAKARLAGIRIGDGMRSAAKSLAILGAAGVAAGATIFKLAQDTADAADELQDFATLNKVSAELVQELGYSAIQNGSSMEDAKASIQGLGKVIGEAMTGVGRGAKMFDKFGISLKNSDGSAKTFEDVLGSVADKMAGMSEQESIAMASKLGISQNMVTLLRNGADGLEAIREEQRKYGIVTTDQLEKTNEFTGTMKGLTQFMNYLKMTIGIAVIPVFQQFIKQVMDSAGGAEGLKTKAAEFAAKLSDALPHILAVASALATVAIKGAEVSGWVAGAVGGWDNFSYALIGIKALSASGLLVPLIKSVWSLNGALLANPIALVAVAIVAALGLIWYNWDSITAKMKQAWNGVGTFFKSVVDKIISYWDAFKARFVDGINSVISMANELPFVDVAPIQGGTTTTANPATNQTGGNNYTNNVTVNATTAQAVDRALSPNFARQASTASFGGVA